MAVVRCFKQYLDWTCPLISKPYNTFDNIENYYLFRISFGRGLQKKIFFLPTHCYINLFIFFPIMQFIMHQNNSTWGLIQNLCSLNPCQLSLGFGFLQPRQGGTQQGQGFTSSRWRLQETIFTFANTFQNLAVNKVLSMFHVC